MHMKIRLGLAAALMLGACTSLGDGESTSVRKVCADCVRETMQRLASPEMRGRGCGTEDERKAAGLLVDKLKAMGVKGAAADGGFLQEAQFTPRTPGGPSRTQNVLGKIQGSAPDADRQA